MRTTIMSVPITRQHVPVLGRHPGGRMERSIVSEQDKPGHVSEIPELDVRAPLRAQ